MKSNESATAMSPTTVSSSIASAVLHDDIFEKIGHVLAAIGRALQKVEDFLPLDHGNRIFLLLEQLSDRPLMRAVSLVLQAIDLHRALQDAGALLQRLDGVADLVGRLG